MTFLIFKDSFEENIKVFGQIISYEYFTILWILLNMEDTEQENPGFLKN